MLKTTEAFENGDAAECYEHFAMMVDNVYLLYGHALMTCSDPYDRIVPIAVSDSREELMVFADLHEMQVEEK